MEEAQTAISDLCQRYQTSINSAQVGQSLGVTHKWADRRLEECGRNILQFYKAVRRWAEQCPYVDRVQGQYRLLSACYYSHLQLYGSLHAHAADTTDHTGFLIIHGVAHKVFNTSNNVLTSKGIAPMSARQKELFQTLTTRSNTPRDKIYGFAVMEVDLNPHGQGAEECSKDIMELFKNAEGLCYVGSCIAKEEARDQLPGTLPAAHQLGIKVIPCTSNSIASIHATLVETQAFQHKPSSVVSVEGAIGGRCLTDEFWASNYDQHDVVLGACTPEMKHALLTSLHRYNPQLCIAVISGTAFSLPAMMGAHLGIAVPSPHAEDIPVDGVPLGGFLLSQADMVLRDGSLRLFLDCIVHAREKLKV
eukprot:NODE_2461_length_1170_cov_34.598274_g2345_i0.p1 GENE.NODE_2461_length_1170_cov_34.598274_g2345_i0~~NODE_2461_length_1170_cov_34.598274_g2345_i0.p1  ORF type:complete len:385 (+),score=108.12 NODE_2461_length_1170_cov_34.598274_g2345_i0:67-1155(+)